MYRFNTSQGSESMEASDISTDTSCWSTTFNSTFNRSNVRKGWFLDNLFSDSPSTHFFSIASSHVYVNQLDPCYPAEVGLTRFSLRDGIVDSMHSIFDSGMLLENLIVEAVQLSRDYHHIPLTGISYPDLATELRSIHTFLHASNDTNWLFIEDSEIEKTMTVFESLGNTSRQLQLGLNWDLKYVQMSTLWSYFKDHLGEQAVPGQVHTVFSSTTELNYLNRCPVHAPLNSLNCARSKAFAGAYILAREFCNKFQVEMIPSRHFPAN